MRGMDEIIGNDAAAAFIGVAPRTWTAYVARKQAPAPDRREISHGHALPVWNRATLEAWKATRPGRGRSRSTESTPAA